MAAEKGSMECQLYRSAFSGELVFRVETTSGQPYEGVTPKHCATPDNAPSGAGVQGQVEVRVLSNGGNEARVSAPDGEILTVPADLVRQM
jgi:hypothetical protein